MQQDEGLASDGVGDGVSPLLEVIAEQRPEGGKGEPLDLGKNILGRRQSQNITVLSAQDGDHLCLLSSPS